MNKPRKYDVSATMELECLERSHKLGDVTYLVEVKLFGVTAPAEPDVGLMSDYIDDWWTEPADFILTDEEEGRALEILNEEIGK